MALGDDQNQRTTKICGNIALFTSCRNGISEYLTDALLSSARSLVLPTRFNHAQCCQQFWRSDFGDRARAESRVDELREHPPRFVVRDRRQRFRLKREPFFRDRLEGYLPRF